MTIQEQIQLLADKKQTVYGVAGTVIAGSVDKEGFTCDVERLDGGADILDAKISIADPAHFVTIPKEGSAVFCVMLSEVDAVVVMVADVEEVIFHGGENGGLTITPELVKGLNKNNAILNAILGILTGPQIPEPGNGSPSALQASLAGAVAGKLVGDFSSIENTKIKH